MRRRALLLLTVASLFAAPAMARDQLRVVGSSTVYPFTTSVAEHFGRAGDFRTPVVESTGTGAGIKLFCEGVGEGFVDIANASRRVLESETKSCAKNGVMRVVEVKIGYDGIALANAASAPIFKLSKKDLFLALARDVPSADGSALVRNPHTRWREVNPGLPDLPIKVYGMPPVSGTRDTFVELVMEKGCKQITQIAALAGDETNHKRVCKLIREDGAFIEVGENGNLIVQKLLGDPESLGILGYSFLDQNTGMVQASEIDGVAPSFEAIQGGTYPISRPLYLYVKGEHAGLVPGLREFLGEFTSESAIGDEGYLVNKGLIPMPPDARNALREETRRLLQ